MAVADMTEAGDKAPVLILAVQQGPDSIRQKLLSWAAAIASVFPDANQSANQRTVTNWVPQLIYQAQQTPTLKADQTPADAVDAGVVLFRSCRAASTAEATGRITSAQAVSLTTAFNTIWT